MANQISHARRKRKVWTNKLPAEGKAASFSTGSPQ
jgi:hypothetical protein